jgi:hypothetical protein
MAAIAREQSVNALSELTGKERRTIKGRLVGLSPARLAGKTPLFDSVKALPLIYEVGKNQTAAESKAIDAARREKAEADSAEIDAAEKMGLLMLKTDARLIWADVTIEVRRTIEGADFLKPEQVQKLLLALSKIRLPDTT